jgi:hypothetical protein
MKKEIPNHRKDTHRVIWQAARMEGKVRAIGINPVRKAKKPVSKNEH